MSFSQRLSSLSYKPRHEDPTLTEEEVSLVPVDNHRAPGINALSGDLSPEKAQAPCETRVRSSGSGDVGFVTGSERVDRSAKQRKPSRTEGSGKSESQEPGPFHSVSAIAPSPSARWGPAAPPCQARAAALCSPRVSTRCRADPRWG